MNVLRFRMDKVPKRELKRRCPSWSPGFDLKCERDADNHTECMSRRPDTSIIEAGGLVRWSRITGMIRPAEELSLESTGG